MSRQAQAEREKQARVILGSAEAEVAEKFVEAARLYASNPAALHLRAMNIIYEATKERGTTILIPSAMVDSRARRHRRWNRPQQPPNPVGATSFGGCGVRGVVRRPDRAYVKGGELSRHWEAHG
jgi:hypothetical protein